VDISTMVVFKSQSKTSRWLWIEFEPQPFLVGPRVRETAKGSLN